MTAALHHRTVGRHVRDRHQYTAGDTPAAAILSRILQPERSAMSWLYGHPEAVILPALAGIFAWGGFITPALILGGAGALLVVVVVMWAAIRRAVEQLITRDEHQLEFELEEVAGG